MGILSLSLYEVNAMNDEKEKRPDPKVLNAVIVANNLAKRALAQTLYTTFEHNMATNVMLIGPTASGKTECCRAIADEFKKPCHWCDCSILSGESYRGDVHLSTVIKGIPDDGRMKILFADEFDKLLFAGSDSYPMKLQSEWLRILDKDPSVFQGCVKPENLTIIATGAFRNSPPGWVSACQRHMR